MPRSGSPCRHRRRFARREPKEREEVVWGRCRCPDLEPATPRPARCLSHASGEGGRHACRGRERESALPCHRRSTATGSDRSNARSTTSSNAAARSSQWRSSRGGERNGGGMPSAPVCCAAAWGRKRSLGKEEGARCAAAWEEEGLRREWREGSGGRGLGGTVEETRRLGRERARGLASWET